VNKKIFIIALSSIMNFFYLSSNAQEKLNCTCVKLKDLPKKLSYKGILKDAYSWADKDGQHLTLITETGEVSSSKDQNYDYRDAALYAYDYIVQKDSFRLIWKLYDFVNECPVDLNVHFVNNTFQITDINKDGVGEIWVMYKMGCYGDVSTLEFI
jgi:hypothetical protein